MGQKKGKAEWKLIAKTYYRLIYYTLYTEKSFTIFTPFFTGLQMEVVGVEFSEEYNTL